MPLVIGTRYNIPFLINKSGVGSYVTGEIYEVDDKMMHILDHLEDCQRIYKRAIQDMNLGIGEGQVLIPELDDVIFVCIVKFFDCTRLITSLFLFSLNLVVYSWNEFEVLLISMKKCFFIYSFVILEWFHVTYFYLTNILSIYQTCHSSLNTKTLPSIRM